MKILNLGLAAVAAFSVMANAVTVKDEKGDFTINKTPERIVALEFSFVDALANVGVTPVGIADDNDAKRLLPQVTENIGEYTSVGTRSQPNLEAIAALKPDLIIADKDRHTAAYDELQKIAPVLLLDSRHGSFDDVLAQSQAIGDVVDKSAEMKEKIDALNQKIADAKAQLPQGQKAFVGASREEGFTLHSNESYSGELLVKLGFVVPPAENNKPLYEVGLEQILALEPDWIFAAHYRDESIVRKWEKEALWQAVKAAQDNHVVSVEPNLWARSRGLFAAHQMVDQVLDAVLKK